MRQVKVANRHICRYMSCTASLLLHCLLCCIACFTEAHEALGCTRLGVVRRVAERVVERLAEAESVGLGVWLGVSMAARVAERCGWAELACC